ncbi:MAG: AsmA family protein [Gammaproteobacteria bacterium]|nr:AsmA family protein [Gammaproteobacteria bacterium]
MKKLIKIIFGLLVVVFVVIIAAVVILPMVISPNDYKPQIIEAVKQQTGRDLVIEGDIGLSVFPKIGLNLGNTSLSNAAGFGEQAFASMQAVNIQVALMPLLDKKVEMDEIVLQGLSLNLQRNKAGKTNWDDLAGKASEKPAKDKTEKPAKASGAQELESLVIGGVRIEDANILWQDDQQGQRYEIKAFNLVSGPLAEGEPVDIEMKTRFLSATPKVDGQLQLTAVVQADPDGSRFTLTDLKFSLDAKGDTLPGGKAQLSLSASQFLLSLKEQTMALSELNVQALGLDIKGAMNGKAIMADNPQFTGKLAIAEFNARELIKALGQAEPDMADAKALTRVSASFDLAATSSSARLQNLVATMDDTKLTGVFALTDFASQAMTFDLNVDQIDLDRYMPAGGQPTEQAPSKKAATSTASAAEAPLFPVETLRKLNANGTARIGLLKHMNLKVNDIVVKVKANGGKVNVKPNASLYQGKFDGDVNIDASRQTPTLKVNSNLQGVQIEPLLKDLQGEAKLAGTTNAKLNISAVGNSQSAVKKTLNGNANFSFKDGALVGVNIAKVIREGMAKFQGKPAPTTNEPEKTDFSSLTGTAKITDGVVNNQDFNMQSPLLRVTGAGKADLVKENLDYLLKASIVGSLQGQGGADLEKLKGVTIPVRVSGPFSKPSYKPDLSAALSDTVKQKAEEKVEEKKQEVQQKLEDKLKSKLKGLF